MITDNLPKKSLAVLMCVGASVAAYGAGPLAADSATIYFRQGVSALEKNYRDNGTVIDSLLTRIDSRISAREGREYRLRQIRITGSASPEGPDKLNLRLSDRRASVVAEIVRAGAEAAGVAPETEYMGRDWSGLLRFVENDRQVPSRQDVIELLSGTRGVTDPVPAEESDRLLAQLRMIGDGRAYRYLYSKYFPDLRYSRVIVDYSYVNPALEPLPPTESYITEIVTPHATNSDYRSTSTLRSAKKPFYMALKTNMLYDVLAIPNIGAEIYVGKNWSLAANWMYGWWSKNSRHRYWRLYGGDLALRRWFGSASRRKPLTGHHLGVYGGVVTYDFEWGGKGYMGGIPGGTLWDRCQYIAGVEYGYSLPVGRRLNIDFTFGIGYRGGKYLEYVPHDNFYLWQSTHKVNWFGPTKAEISLVWLIGRDNRNVRKGGRL